MHIQRHIHTRTYVQSAHKRNGDNQAQEPGWERRKKGFVGDLAHTQTQKKTSETKPIFTNLKEKIRAHRASSKATRLFLRSNKSNINQSDFISTLSKVLQVLPRFDPDSHLFICDLSTLHRPLWFGGWLSTLFLETSLKRRELMSIMGLDLLRGCRKQIPNAHCQKSISIHNHDVHCLEGTPGSSSLGHYISR